MENYFGGEFIKHAQFKPAANPPVTYTVSGITGAVNGSANWTSTKHPNPGVNFDFEFKFVFDNNKWLILNMDCYKKQSR